MRRERLTVVCFKWRPPVGYRSKFSAEHVNVLQRMVARNLRRKHRFVCVTDDARGLECESVPLWPDHARVPSPHGHGNPSCYRRLKLFSADAADVFGPRIVSIDLDCVVTGDLGPLFERDEEFVIWGDTARGTPYNGSLLLLRAGTRAKVWSDFNPITSPQAGRRLGYVGSDQAWIGACLGPHEPKWSGADGVYSFRNQIQPPRGNGALPKGARLVMFHGHHDPWDDDIQQRYEWVRRYWR